MFGLVEGSEILDNLLDCRSEVGLLSIQLITCDSNRIYCDVLGW
jgi:hypothetical protein